MPETPREWLDRFAPEWVPKDLSVTINGQTMEAEVDRLRGFVQMQQLYRAAAAEITTKLQTLDSEFSVRYAHNPIHHIDSRLKSPRSIAEKLRRKGMELSIAAAREHLVDIAGVRVVCNYIEDIYDIAGMLEKQSDITLLRRRDYIADPKENGYRSLHLIVEVPVFLSDRTEHVPVEVQIRTIAMDFWASLEHELRYKAATELTHEQRARLKECAEASARLDAEMQSIRRQCIKSQQG